MRLLLDTCALLWFVDDADALSPRARSVLDDPTNEVLVSVASYWEIVVKFQKGRLELPLAPDRWFTAAVHPDAIVPIEMEDVTELQVLGPAKGHKDSFDRLLIATARRHGLTVVTSDSQFRSYDVPVEW